MKWANTTVSGLFLSACLLAAASSAQEPSTNPSSAATSVSKNSAGATSTAAADHVVLKVGTANVTAADFDLLVEDFTRDNGAAPNDRKNLAENYASALMLSQQALASHLDSDPVVKRKLETMRIQVLSDAAYAQIERQAKPTPQEVSQYYAAHLADYDLVEIRRIFIWKENKDSKDNNGLSPQEAQAKADAILHALSTGGDAKSLIRGSKSILDADPLDFGRSELPPYMSQAFEMKVGEWSQIASTPDALILFQVVKRNRRSLHEVSPVIEKKLQAERMRSALDALKEKSSIWMDKQYFESSAASASSTTQSPDDGPSRQTQAQNQ